MARIIIDNKEYKVDDGKNLLEACLSLCLDLPYFCWHPELDSVGACRQCAVIKYQDEDDKNGKLTMACMEPVIDNLRISLDVDEAKQFRAANIEALMINHPHDCPVCDEGGECHLQDMTVMTGHNYRRYRFSKRTHNNQYLGPFINHEMNRCIQCYRCVRFYKDYAGGKDLDVFGAHDNLYFGRHEPGTLENEFSGNLVEICPTGVFTDKTLKKHYTRKWDLTGAPSVCHNCGLGCNIIASERYGSIRRILSRYNGEVNGYFLCDRGRFGYEYVNSEKRILFPVQKQNNSFVQKEKKEIIQQIKRVSKGKKLVGIGSPRASLESNFLLRQWVGANNFYAGIYEAEGKLVQKAVEILKNGKVKTPSLNEVKEYDAVLILGEDVTNTAPMLALNLRQTVRNKPAEVAAKLKIPSWSDAGIREVIQDDKGPFFIASAHYTKLDEIATQTWQAHPDNIARLGHKIARKITGQFPDFDTDDETDELAGSIAEALSNAKKPLIVSGTSLFSEAVIEAAANVAFALKEKDKDAGLVFVAPEVNSVGLSLICEKYLEQAVDDTYQNENSTLVILENDLSRRMEKNSNSFLQKFENIIVLDYLENATTQQAEIVLPAGTFAESDGTVINNEGRAQRFYRAHVPDNEVKSSWKWLQEFLPVEQGFSNLNLDGITDKLIETFPELEGIQSAAPSVDFRKGTQKIPRAPHRYSGRTAMHANLDVNEPKPPEDTDSALSPTMEGYSGIPPSGLTPFYWSPGWNSVQAINKYQIEVGGGLHGGNPGVRLFKIKDGGKTEYFRDIPKRFASEKEVWQALPIYHIFGSEELSAQSPAVNKRITKAYIALNNSDALEASVKEDDFVEFSANGEKHRCQVRLNAGLAKGTIGLPTGLNETAGIRFPLQIKFKKVNHE